ncbi:MAG: thrombospondin type 3 repeat-containing protein [Nitrospirae bacterium]|nr:thrombospondin type 3 repeat-containing protein [Nitrospirota bacterium]
MKCCTVGRFEGVVVFSVLVFLLVFCVSGYGEDLIDTDSDGIVDSVDNCLLTYNPDQADNDALAGITSAWKFDEVSGGNANDSINGNTGIIYGAAWADGKVNGGLTFDGTNDYVDIGKPMPANLRVSSVTLEAWVNPSAYANAHGNIVGGIIASQYDADMAGYSMSIDYRNDGSHKGVQGGIHFQVGSGTGFWTNGVQGTTNVALPLNQWTHVVTVEEANKAYKVYFNGVLVADWVPGSGIAYTDNNRLAIGWNESAPGVTRYFNGKVDEVAVYNRALTAEEIQQQYQHGLTGNGVIGDGIGDVCDNDQDNDGYASPQDCDDSNASVNPSATEMVNNGQDDDCNPNTPAVSVSGNAYNYPILFFRASLSLNVSALSLETGYFRYYYTRNRLNFVSTSITGISATGGIATVTGVGKVNGISGYTFTAAITDGTADAIGLVIKKPDGTLYYNTPSLTVTSGNYTIVGQ